jgi:hypothetical protein
MTDYLFCYKCRARAYSAADEKDWKEYEDVVYEWQEGIYDLDPYIKGEIRQIISLCPSCVVRLHEWFNS